MSNPVAMNKAFADLRAQLLSMPEHTCGTCGGVFFGVPAPRCFDCEQAELAAKDAERKALAELAQVDRRFALVTIEGYRCPPGDIEARRLVQAWRPPRGLYVYGPPGGGKSHLAFARAKELIHEGKRVFATDWTELLKRLKATFDGRGKETTADLLARIDGADVLVIDDLLAGKVTEWAIEQVWSIVQGRYQSERPLVCTSNYTLGELGGRIGGVDGQRIASRLAEMCDRVRVDAPDFRMNAAAHGAARRSE